jgi:type III restriction enzyme
MAKSVIVYDKELPEIPSRQAWLKPDCFLLKDKASPDGWRIDTSGRRPSRLLLIERLRVAVDRWRDEGYPGASDVSRRLFEYWFEEEHEVTLVYLVEVAGISDVKPLIDSFAKVYQKDLLSKNIEFLTRLENGKAIRQLRRYVAELDRDGIQDLPPEQVLVDRIREDVLLRHDEEDRLRPELRPGPSASPRSPARGVGHVGGCGGCSAACATTQAPHHARGGPRR